jgi:predicted RNase H-like nuclease (RuvC/YqgF family)
MIGAMIEYNKEDRTVVLQLENLYSAISFCMTSIQKIESRILDAQIENGHLEMDNKKLKKENKELKKKVEELLERVQL